MRRKAITAIELLAKLQADPAYVKMRAEKDAALEATAANYRAEEAPIVADLTKVGCLVESVWDLVNMSTPYPEAIPVLLDHLQRPYSDRVKERIARSLAVPEAIGAWAVLVRLYETAADGSDTKSGLAVALATLSTDAVIGELVRAAKDARNGASRILLLRGLRRSRSSIAREALSELKNDPALAKEIASGNNLIRRTKPKKDGAHTAH